MKIIFDYYNTLYKPDSQKLFRGALPLLKKLKRKNTLVLITTASPSRWQEIMTLRLSPFFSQIILCKVKTRQLFLPYIKDNTLIIGDRKESEIQIGNSLKIQTLLVSPKQENPVISIRNFLKV